MTRGGVIKELGLRRTDLIITTKLFWGGPNDRGLSRKQYVHDRRYPPTIHVLAASLRQPKSPWNALVLTTLTSSPLTARMSRARYSRLHEAIDDNSVVNSVRGENRSGIQWVIEKDWVCRPITGQRLNGPRLGSRGLIMSVMN